MFSKIDLVIVKVILTERKNEYNRLINEEKEDIEPLKREKSFLKNILKEINIEITKVKLLNSHYDNTREYCFSSDDISTIILLLNEYVEEINGALKNRDGFENTLLEEQKIVRGIIEGFRELHDIVDCCSSDSSDEHEEGCGSNCSCGK